MQLIKRIMSKAEIAGIQRSYCCTVLNINIS